MMQVSNDCVPVCFLSPNMVQRTESVKELENFASFVNNLFESCSI